MPQQESTLLRENSTILSEEYALLASRFPGDWQMSHDIQNPEGIWFIDVTGRLVCRSATGGKR